ncbi:MAG: T9SS type A sorting domain-containing protein [Saprospiraceae bacterium]|nr:T9SS type A sorting domain-containing protein [Saprospiraceae bacterium]
MILNLAVEGCYDGCGWTSCGWLSWDTERSCHVSCTTDFPKTFEIDWIKGYQKENQAIYIKGTNELCVDKSFTFKAPNYPNATYNWTGTSGLQIHPWTWLNPDGGLWQSADITALSPGLQTVTLTVSFPSGYVETKTFDIWVQSGQPTPPTNISFMLTDIDCCYNLSTPVVSGATSYIWAINNNYTYTTPTNYSDACLYWGNQTVSVAAQNSCGVSTSYSKTQNLPRPGCWDDPMKLVVSPNPSSSLITLKFLNNQNMEITEIYGKVFITNIFGNTVLQKTIVNSLEEIEIQNMPNGLYHIIFQNDLYSLSTTFLKNDGN